MTTQPLNIALSNAAATRSLGQWLGEHLPAGIVVLLMGDLGSGKTTLTKGLGEGLGITEAIDSPTFTLINEYLEGRLPLYHIDLYRLQPSEVDGLYLETYWDEMEREPGIVAIEWADRLAFLPDCPLKIELTYAPNGGRQATLTPANSTQTQLLETLKHHALLAHEV